MPLRLALMCFSGFMKSVLVKFTQCPGRKATVIVHHIKLVHVSLISKQTKGLKVE